MCSSSPAKLSVPLLSSDVVCTSAAQGPGGLGEHIYKTPTVKEEGTKTQGLILSRHSSGGHHENFENSITDKSLSPQANCKVYFVVVLFVCFLLLRELL